MPDYTITTLNISSNELTQLPNDIDKYTNLKTLNCSNNKLTQCDNLPKELENLVCNRNNITQLDNLPLSLKKLVCYKNSLIYDFEPTLENIKKYNASYVNILTS